MPFNVGDAVGIRLVRDTGLVSKVHPRQPPPTEYDVARDQAGATELYPEPALFSLPVGKRRKVHERQQIVDGRGILLVCEYQNRRGLRTVSTTMYRIVNGHNMGRIPR